MTFNAKQPAVRFMLKAITEAVKDSRLTALLRLDCVEVENELDSRGLTVCFVMATAARADELKGLLTPTVFKAMRKAYAEGADSELFNVRAISR